MKILQVLCEFPPTSLVAPGIHAQALAHAFAKRKHGVATLHTVLDHARPAGTIVENTVDGARTIVRVRHDDFADARASWVDPSADQDFASVLEREHPDVVHFHDLAAWGPRCIATAREHGATVVLTLHDFHALCDRRTLLRVDGALCPRAGEECGACLAHYPLAAPSGAAERVERLRALQGERRAHFQRALAHAHAVIAPSRHVARVFVQAGWLSGPLVEILSLGTAGPAHKPRARRGGKLRLGFVGELAPAQGAQVLIDALALLAKAPVELAVHATGGDPEYARELERRAAGLQVTFHARRDPRAIDALLAGFDVLVVPSLVCGNPPPVVLDAFRNGLAVVASDAGGLQELVQDGIHGLVFPRGDARSLARCLQSLLVDPELYNRLTRDRPPLVSVDSVAERLERIYSRFQCARRAPPSARADQVGGER